MKKNKENILESIRISLESLLANPAMLSRMGKHGYTQKTILEAKALYEKVYMLESVHHESLGMQQNATRQLNAARKELHSQYMRHLTLTRFALKDQREMWKLLRMEGARKTNISEWLEQVRAFYTHVGRVADSVEKFGFSREEIAQGMAMVEAISQYRINQSLGKGNAQDASLQYKETFRQLQQWMKDFRYIARYALKDNLQQLESLGVVVKS